MNRKQPGPEQPGSGQPDMAQWWTQLKASTQAWLAEHNGEAVPASIQQEIIQAGGSLAPDAWWTGSGGTSEFRFSDAGVDWIEAAANGELPPAP